jgi:hypothetical protein
MLLATLPAQCAFVSGFCSSGYDFAFPSSRLNLTIQTLGVATEFVGNYASVDFHHRALICPSYKRPPLSIDNGGLFRNHKIGAY